MRKTLTKSSNKLPLSSESVLVPLTPSCDDCVCVLLCLASRRSGPGGGKSVFELKKDYEEEYNPFFYHYSRVDHSKVCHVTVT